MSDYKLTVGLEVHAELNTRTKMFCDSRNESEAAPNTNICPVCMGYPGTLPVINKEAVRSVLRFGLAVGGKLADYTEFDRKNYFYPDIPKGYQLSQYKHPLVSGGQLAGVKLTRVHLEEDTARSTHDKGEESLLDFNRAGVPLMELVTEPVIKSPEEAARFAKELQLLLTYLGISHANMEKGEMRVEANISVSSDTKLGTKVEVKNLNSFRAVERAIAYEYQRQVALLEEGSGVVQETRGWNESKGETFSQRVKEDSHDYRYFPDPDLPKLFISEVPEFSEAALRASLPELPEDLRKRLKGLGLKEADVEIYVGNDKLKNYILSVALATSNPELTQLASNYLVTSPEIAEVPVSHFQNVLEMLMQGKLSSTNAKAVLKNPDINIEDLLQINDKEVLRKIVAEVIAENKVDVPVQFLVGQAMKKSGGRANPVVLQTLFVEMLNR